MPRIDAHQHYWRYHPQHYPWIDERMSVLRQDFDPPRLRPLLQEQGFDGALAVQARPSEDETLALLALAEQGEGVCGVVGWLDIATPQLAQRLEALRPYSAARGAPSGAGRSGSGGLAGAAGGGTRHANAAARRVCVRDPGDAPASGGSGGVRRLPR